MELPDNSLVLASEPLKGIEPDDMRQWLVENNTEEGIAKAMALVTGKAGWLDDEVYDYEMGTSEYEKAAKIADAWRALEEELYKRIINILKEENASGKVNHKITEKGWYYMIIPFMKRNGYSHGSGWWV